MGFGRIRPGVHVRINARHRFIQLLVILGDGRLSALDKR